MHASAPERQGVGFEDTDKENAMQQTAVLMHLSALAYYGAPKVRPANLFGCLSVGFPTHPFVR